MNVSEQTSIPEEAAVVQRSEPAEPAAPEQRRVKWSDEVERRSRRLQQLLDAETTSPNANEPWRIELIKRARFTMWLDERSVAISRRGTKTNA